MKKKKTTKADTLENLVHLSQEKINTAQTANSFLVKTHGLADEEASEGDEETMSEEELKQELLQASELLTESPPMIYSDKFAILSDAFRPEFVKGIELPKMILKKTREDEQAIQDKSVVMVYLNVTMESVKGGCFKQLYKATRKGPIKLHIKWLDEKEGVDPSEAEGLSLWKFENARIHGIDFGDAMSRRPDINSVSIEITYDNISIDGISL